MQYTDYSTLFWALANENRVKIIDLLVAHSKERRSGKNKDAVEISASDLLESFSFSQPTLSHHMKILCDSGVVIRRKEGKNIFYSMDTRGTVKLQEFIKLLSQA